jgi:hypothetical protein
MKRMIFTIILMFIIISSYADVWVLKAKDYNGKWYTQKLSKQEYIELYDKYKIKVENTEGDFTNIVPRCHKADHVELSTFNLNVKRAKLIHYYQD